MTNSSGVDPLVQELHLYRIMLNVSMATVAKRAGVARSTIAAAESGEHTPNIAIVRRWANAFDLDLALVERDGDRAASVQNQENTE